MAEVHYRTYVVQNIIKAFERFDPRPEDTPDDPGKPSVAPEGSTLFPVETMEQLNDFREKALLVPTFEAFMVLLENVATELDLNPAQDFDKLASVLNRFRTEEGLEPL